MTRYVSRWDEFVQRLDWFWDRQWHCRWGNHMIKFSSAPACVRCGKVPR